MLSFRYIKQISKNVADTTFSVCNFLKKRLQQRFFPVNIAKLKISVLIVFYSSKSKDGIFRGILII